VLEHLRDHAGGGGGLARRGDGGREARPGQHEVHRRLVAGAIHLEVAHHQDAAPARLHEREGIGGEEAGGIEQVGVGLRSGVDEPRADSGRTALRH
jgi:hypothetical protein